MKYYIHFGTNADGPYWSIQYAKEMALRVGPDMMQTMEIRDQNGRFICRSEFYSGWHDPDTDPTAMIDMGEAGWFGEWK